MNTIYRIRAIGTDTYYSGGADGFFSAERHVENYSTPGAARGSWAHRKRTASRRKYEATLPEVEIVPFAVTEIQGKATRA